jgi:pimeloyl-ACP methyl ester carboxylesterase
VWDVATNTLHLEADELLDQHTSYALIVTQGLRDTLGHPVEPAKAFPKFLYGLNFGQTKELREYRWALLRGLVAAALFGVLPHEVVVASVFTTQSITAMLETVRDQIVLGTPTAADFAIGPGGTRAAYPLSALTDIVSVRQTGTAPTFSPTIIPFTLMSVLAPGAVGTVAFGKYLSPDFMTADRFIPFPGTRLSTPAIQGVNEIYFNLVLPAGPRPPQGWPVVISGHGSGGDKQLAAYLVAATMAAHGIATIAINAVGHGFGPLSTLSLLRAADTPIMLPGGGRGIDTNANGQITSTEGSFALAPRGIIRDRDARIQTAADLMQLVRVIEVGVDVDGDGVSDLDPSRIYYFGHSLGGNYGAVFLSAEPNVRAGVLAAPGGPPLEGSRLSPPNRASLGALLAARVPSLINLSGTNFDENLPLRDQTPVINTVPGAMEIQELLDNFEWVGQGGDVVAYGPYLRRAPLDGAEPKPVIIQFARGDRTLPNPTTTAILRAGELADRATYYRFDHFLADNPTTPPSFNDPHGPIVFPQPPFVVLPPEVREAVTAVALSAQEQIAVFFASDGANVVDPDGPGALFETPIVPPLPEDVVFFP